MPSFAYSVSILARCPNGKVNTFVNSRAISWMTSAIYFLNFFLYLPSLFVDFAKKNPRSLRPFSRRRARPIYHVISPFEILFHLPRGFQFHSFSSVFFLNFPFWDFLTLSCFFSLILPLGFTSKPRCYVWHAFHQAFCFSFFSSFNIFPLSNSYETLAALDLRSFAAMLFRHLRGGRPSSWFMAVASAIVV